MLQENKSLFINNEWRSGSGQLFSSLNPANGNKNWHGREALKSDVDDAIKHAKKAFEIWSAIPIEERIQFLERFKNLLRDSQQHFAEVISKETGKPLWESKIEVLGMIDKVDISVEAYDRRCPEMIRNLPHAQLITRHKPHGVIAILGPFNFPAHLPNGHIMPALLAGNTIVYKSSEMTPLVAEEMMHLWEKVNLPPGVINLVQGGKETGQHLIQHPDIRGIFFTGSYSTGVILSQILASTPEKILALELGGNNPLVVGDITDLDAAAYTIIQSAYLTSGQRCTCARRLVLPNNESGENLIAHLIEKIKSLTIGSYKNIPEPFMGPVISDHQVQTLLKHQEKLMSQGGIPLLSMRQINKETGFISPGLMDVTLIKNRPDIEIFGPFLQVIRVNQFQEAIEEANRTSFGLAAGLLSDKEEEYHQFFRQIQAGVVNWNIPLTGASSAAPFGGIKCSGNYRPSAYYAADYCAYPIASLETNVLKMPSTLLPGLENFR